MNLLALPVMHRDGVAAAHRGNMQRSITKSPRAKSHKKDEDLRGELREIKKENSALRKRLKQLEKNRLVWEQYNLDADEESEQESTIKNKEVSCPSCQHGTLLSIDLGIRWLYTCSTCTFRKVTLK